MPGRSYPARRHVDGWPNRICSDRCLGVRARSTADEYEYDDSYRLKPENKRGREDAGVRLFCSTALPFLFLFLGRGREEWEVEQPPSQCTLHYLSICAGNLRSAIIPQERLYVRTRTAKVFVRMCIIHSRVHYSFHYSINPRSARGVACVPHGCGVYGYFMAMAFPSISLAEFMIM